MQQVVKAGVLPPHNTHNTHTTHTTHTLRYLPTLPYLDCRDIPTPLLAEIPLFQNKRHHLGRTSPHIIVSILTLSLAKLLRFDIIVSRFNTAVWTVITKPPHQILFHLHCWKFVLRTNSKVQHRRLSRRLPSADRSPHLQLVVVFKKR